MIPFYDTFEYTKLHRKLFDAKIGTAGVTMQTFVRSHKGDTFDLMNVDRWMEFLDFNRMFVKSSDEKKARRFRRMKFAELIKKQIDAGLLTPDSALKRGNKVSLTIVPF